MTGVGDQDPGGPVDPLVAATVVDLQAFGVIPYDRWLAAHGHRFVGIEAFEDGSGCGGRYCGDDAPVGRFDPWYAFRNEVKFSGHWYDSKVWEAKLRR